MRSKIMALFIGAALLTSSFSSFSQINESIINPEIIVEQAKCYMAINSGFTTTKTKAIRAISADLDGDGKKDAITLIYYSEDYAILQVNKTEMVIDLSGSGDPDAIDVKVVDLVKADKPKQLEFRELTTDIYAHRELICYKNGKLEIIPMPRPSNTRMVVSATYDGKGTITHAYVNQSLYTWFYKENFKYDGKKISYVSKNTYNLDTSTTAETVIKLQRSPTDKRTVFKTAKGMKLTIVETNGKGWFKVKNSSGKMGWFFFDDKTDKIQGKPSLEVFKGLPNVG